MFQLTSTDTSNPPYHYRHSAQTMLRQRRCCWWLGAGLLLLATAAVTNAFVPPGRVARPHPVVRTPQQAPVAKCAPVAPVAPAARLPSRLVRGSSSVSAADVEAKLEGVWDKDVPPSIEAVIAQAQASLGAALEAGEKRIRVDIRTPGLDEALEQTAIREKSLLLSVVSESLVPWIAPSSPPL